MHSFSCTVNSKPAIHRRQTETIWDFCLNPCCQLLHHFHKIFFTASIYNRLYSHISPSLFILILQYKPGLPWSLLPLHRPRYIPEYFFHQRRTTKRRCPPALSLHTIKLCLYSPIFKRRYPIIFLERFTIITCSAKPIFISDIRNAFIRIQ